MEAWRDELLHYGVKGMKWGIRRAPKQLGRRLPNKTSQREQTGVEKTARIGKIAAATALGIVGGYAVVKIAVSPSARAVITDAIDGLRKSDWIYYDPKTGKTHIESVKEAKEYGLLDDDDILF